MRRTKETYFNILIWKCQDHFYKYNGFAYILKFKVPATMLPVKADFASQKCFQPNT